MSSPSTKPSAVPAGAGPLPPLVVVGDSDGCRDRVLFTVLEQAVAGGARAVWLREKKLPPSDRSRLALLVADLLHDVGGVLIASPGPGSEVADGMHLAAGDPKGADGVFGRSCHSRADLERAAHEGCRWATLSPIFAPVSKPGYGPELGVGSLADCPLPVWALGGVHAGNAAGCVRAGASGVAVLGSVLSAPDPAGEVARLLGALR